MKIKQIIIIKYWKNLIQVPLSREYFTFVIPTQEED